VPQVLLPRIYFVSQEDCFGIDVNCFTPTASTECSQQHCERQCYRFRRVYLALYTTFLQPTKGQTRGILNQFGVAAAIEHHFRPQAVQHSALLEYHPKRQKCYSRRPAIGSSIHLQRCIERCGASRTAYFEAISSSVTLAWHISCTQCES
jgi:hypothetical protein